MSFPWTYWILPALVVAIWVVAWWCSRRFRLWFAVLAPVAAVGGIVLGLTLIFSDPASCPGTSCGDVSTWAASVDSPAGIDALLQAGSVLAFLTAVPLTLVTLVIEYVLLVRRQNREAAVHQAEEKAAVHQAEEKASGQSRHVAT
jgi:hypothetical protein